MMTAKTIQRNIKSSFPLIASLEIRFYGSSGFIIFQLKKDVSFNKRSLRVQCSLRKGINHAKTTSQLWLLCKNLTLEDNNTNRIPFRVEKIEKNPANTCGGKSRQYC